MRHRAFTLRQDGQERTTLRIELHLTRDEWERVEAVAAWRELKPDVFARHFAAKCLMDQVSSDLETLCEGIAAGQVTRDAVPERFLHEWAARQNHCYGMAEGVEHLRAELGLDERSRR